MTNAAPRLTAALTVWHAWMEDSDMWDGNALYADLETAKLHAAYDYEGDEYGHFDDADDDPDSGSRAKPEFTWVEEHGYWHLLDHGKNTLVQVSPTWIWRPSTEREIEQQDALTAAEEAARAMTPHMPLAMALEHEAAKRTDARQTEPRIPDHVVNEEQPASEDEETFCTFGEGDAPGSGCILPAGHEPANRHLYTPGDGDFDG